MMGTFLLADGPGCGHFVCFYLMAFPVGVRDGCRGSMCTHTHREDMILRVLQLILLSDLNELRLNHLTPLQLASGGQGFKSWGSLFIREPSANSIFIPKPRSIKSTELSSIHFPVDTTWYRGREASSLQFPRSGCQQPSFRRPLPGDPAPSSYTHCPMHLSSAVSQE